MLLQHMSETLIEMCPNSSSKLVHYFMRSGPVVAMSSQQEIRQSVSCDATATNVCILKTLYSFLSNSLCFFRTSRIFFLWVRNATSNFLCNHNCPRRLKENMWKARTEERKIEKQNNKIVKYIGSNLGQSDK